MKIGIDIDNVLSNFNEVLLNVVNDTIRMYKKRNIKMYKNVNLGIGQFDQSGK